MHFKGHFNILFVINSIVRRVSIIPFYVLRILVYQFDASYLRPSYTQITVYFVINDAISCFNRIRRLCTWMVTRSWFDNIVLLFIALNCITLAMERPNIPPDSKERAFLGSANYVFTVVFAVEMFIKVNKIYFH